MPSIITTAQNVMYSLDLEEFDEDDIYCYIANRSKRSGLIKISITVAVSEEFNIKSRLDIYITNTPISVRIKHFGIGDNFSTSSQITIFRRVHDIFDSRSDYNNPELSYNVHIDRDVKITDYFKQIEDYRRSLQPFIDSAFKSYDSGEYEKFFEIYTGRKFKRGNEVLTDSFSSLVHYLESYGIDKVEEYVCIKQFMLYSLPRHKKFKSDNNLDLKDGMTIDEYTAFIRERYDFIREYMLNVSQINNIMSDAEKEMKLKFEAIRKEICERCNLNEKDFIIGLNVIR